MKKRIFSYNIRNFDPSKLTVSSDGLVSARSVLEVADTQYEIFKAWFDRYDFPKPVKGECINDHFYSFEDIKKWHENIRKEISNLYSVRIDKVTHRPL